MKSCTICGITESDTRIILSKTEHFCRKHYLQIYKHGKVAKTIYDPNEFILHDAFAEIVLCDINGCVVGKTTINLEDVEKCRLYKWHMRKSRNTSYALTSIASNKKLFLHRFILNYDGDMDVDHINRDGLDNTRENLRVVSHSDNIANNAYKGVKTTPSGNWQASITHNYDSIYIGTFDNYADALSAREAKRSELRD